MYVFVCVCAIDRPIKAKRIYRVIKPLKPHIHTRAQQTLPAAAIVGYDGGGRRLKPSQATTKRISQKPTGARTHVKHCARARDAFHTPHISNAHTLSNTCRMWTCATAGTGQTERMTGEHTLAQLITHQNRANVSCGEIINGESIRARIGYIIFFLCIHLPSARRHSQCVPERAQAALATVRMSVANLYLCAHQIGHIASRFFNLSAACHVPTTTTTAATATTRLNKRTMRRAQFTTHATPYRMVLYTLATRVACVFVFACSRARAGAPPPPLPPPPPSPSDLSM